nr:sorting nexin 14 [Hymenolepis microstoma]
MRRLDIFDVIIERFILRWFSKLTNDEKFTADIKAQLQHICSVLFLRIKTVDISNLIEQKLLPCVVHHVEHLLALTNVFSHLDAFFEPTDGDEIKTTPPADEVVLQRLYSAGHLHLALQSRQSESLYLQEICQKLLPHLLIPPSLKHSSRSISKPPFPVNGSLQPSNIIDQAFSSSQFFHQLPKSAEPTVSSMHPTLMNPNQTQAAQCTRSFLTEVLANHVLLPALDSIANPDSLNTVFLYLLDPITDNDDYPKNAPMFPLLNNYIDDWFKNAKELPSSMRMEALLHQPKQLGNFVQYMKSINCSSTMTVLLLMFEVVNKIETESISSSLCERLKVPLHQLLHLLHSGRVMATEDLHRHNQFDKHNHGHDSSNADGSNICADCGLVVSPPGYSQLTELLNLPPSLTTVIAEAVNDRMDPLCVGRVVHTPEWTSAYRTMCSTMETFYLPAYMESPEYLGRLGVSSPNATPKYQFFHPNEESSYSGTNGMLNLRDPALEKSSKSFYKSTKHSSSHKDLAELERLRGGRFRNSKDDLSTTGRSSSRLPFKRRQTNAIAPPSALSSSLNDDQSPEEPSNMESSEIRELDFSKWEVSIPFYASASGKNLTKIPGGRLNGANSTSSASNMLLTMNLEQPDFSMFSLFNNSICGNYTVIADREVNGKRVSSKVTRKYAEFYVLEQRLIEFHGSQISRRLPTRRYGAQSHQFLVNMKTYFERYIGYLLAQRFLRSSELMYTFLTAPEVEFTSSTLLELRLGKFVKSVPILLAKEKGQFTDEFLTTFRTSCFVQPQNSNSKTPVIGITQSAEGYHNKSSMLDHRLRSNIYWNNAGIPNFQKRRYCSEFCAMEGSYVTSFYDFFGYLVDNFRKPDVKVKVISGDDKTSSTRRQRVDSTAGKFSVLQDFLLWIHRIGASFWCVIKVIWYEIIYALGRNGWPFEALDLPRPNRLNISIGTHPRYLPGLLRRAILNVGLALRNTQFRDLVDLHIRRHVDRFLSLLVRNDVLASMLILLRNSIFFPSPPRSERDKATRREKVYIGLMRLINRFHLQWFSEGDVLQRRLARVFEVFQHGKWNKQLTYTLLDHILLELFPDVFDPHSLPLDASVTTVSKSLLLTGKCRSLIYRMNSQIGGDRGYGCKPYLNCVLHTMSAVFLAITFGSSAEAPCVSVSSIMGLHMTALLDLSMSVARGENAMIDIFGKKISCIPGNEPRILGFGT